MRSAILLVDDRQELVTLGERLLMRLGYDVIGQTNSLEALLLFRDAPERFALVLTDLEMPQMNGKILAERLWGIRADLPIILCTGSNSMTLKEAQLLGFETLLRKPFRLRDLTESVEHALSARASSQF